jgi:glucose/arabinose dehydrogenase
MNVRALTATSAALLCGCLSACAGATTRAAAASLPTAPGGQTVTQVTGPGPGIATAFAFGNGQVFLGKAGGPNGVPPGGVDVITHGVARRLPGSPGYVAGLTWHRGTLYVSAASQLLAWSGWNGSSFTRRRTIFTGRSGFSGFSGLGFGADGRLYAGVAVAEDGPTADDHGPTSDPHARQSLAFTPTGGDLRVVARGIRQPWQMAFPAGSSSPFVSDLGQDSGADQSLVQDFILRVKPGQNYGYPSCNWIVLQACAGRARPFRFLPPHTDPIGVGIIGQRLYIAEFGSAEANTPAQVVSIGFSGGPVRPLLTGFTQPVAALGTNGGSVYAGTIDGQVVRVTP